MRTEIEWACSTCDAPFILSPAQAARVRKDRRTRVFCSRACAGIEPVTTNCGYCDVTFAPGRSTRARMKRGEVPYCTAEHYHAANRTFVCLTCATPYEASAWERRQIRNGREPQCSACKSK